MILLLTAPSMGWFLTYKTAWFLEKAQPVFSFVTPGLLLMGTVTAVGMILLEKYGPQMLTLLEQKGAVGPVTSALKVLGRGDGGKSSRGIRVRS